MKTYKMLGIDPKIHDQVMSFKREHDLKGASEVLALLLEFFESEWTDKDKLNAILEKIRKDGEE